MYLRHTNPCPRVPQFYNQRRKTHVQTRLCCNSSLQHAVRLVWPPVRHSTGLHLEAFGNTRSHENTKAPRHIVLRELTITFSAACFAAPVNIAFLDDL